MFLFYHADASSIGREVSRAELWTGSSCSSSRRLQGRLEDGLTLIEREVP